MSDLSLKERTKLEKLLNMQSGYVLNFNDRTFATFVVEHIDKDITSEEYRSHGSSKANRLRALWEQEPNHIVGKLLVDLLDYCKQDSMRSGEAALHQECYSISQRLLHGGQAQRAPASVDNTLGPFASGKTMEASGDVLIVTVTPVESRAIMQALEQATGQKAHAVSIKDRVYRDLGRVSGAHVFMAISELGAGGLGASLQTVQKGIDALRPSAVIMVGIAFGVDEQHQTIGDILVSRQLLLYELQRVGRNEIILRGDRPHASPRLINYLQSAYLDWTGAPVRFGLVLTGEKLVDNIDYRDQLKRLNSEAVGGEMEGAGLYAACQDAKVDWILVKAICDWADGDKKKDKDARQQQAAQNAAAFVLHALQHASLKHPGQPGGNERGAEAGPVTLLPHQQMFSVRSNNQQGGISAGIVHIGTQVNNSVSMPPRTVADSILNERLCPYIQGGSIQSNGGDPWPSGPSSIIWGFTITNEGTRPFKVTKIECSWLPSEGICRWAKEQGINIVLPDQMIDVVIKIPVDGISLIRPRESAGAQGIPLHSSAVRPRLQKIGIPDNLLCYWPRSIEPKVVVTVQSIDGGEPRTVPERLSWPNKISHCPF